MANNTKFTNTKPFVNHLSNDFFHIFLIANTKLLTLTDQCDDSPRHLYKESHSNLINNSPCNTELSKHWHFKVHNLSA